MAQNKFEKHISDFFNSIESKEIVSFIPHEYVYDDEASILFAKIYENKGYYSYHSELEAIEYQASRISEKLGPRALLIEYGSGLCKKSKPILRAMKDIVGFVALDIDPEILKEAKIEMKSEFPNLDMHTIGADFFTDDLKLPDVLSKHNKKAIFMSGSNINIFNRKELEAFFMHIVKMLDSDDLLLLTIDPLKDLKKTYASYSSKYFGAFHKNILTKLNKEYNANFLLDNFEHIVEIAREDELVHTYIECKFDHEIKIGNTINKVPKGKRIEVKLHKYNLNTVKELGKNVGLTVYDTYTDPDGMMMIIGLEKIAEP